MRWNSTFYALELVYKMIRTKKEAFRRVLRSVNLTLSADDHNFIRQFVLCYAPFAKALDFLQGEKQAYLGYLLPTLARLREMLQNVIERQQDTQLVRPLARALACGLEKRFATNWEDRNALIAAAYVPEFKLGSNTTWPWIPATQK